MWSVRKRFQRWCPDLVRRSWWMVVSFHEDRDADLRLVLPRCSHSRSGRVADGCKRHAWAHTAAKGPCGPESMLRRFQSLPSPLPLPPLYQVCLALGSTFGGFHAKPFTYFWNSVLLASLWGGLNHPQYSRWGNWSSDKLISCFSLHMAGAGSYTVRKITRERVCERSLKSLLPRV